MLLLSLFVPACVFTPSCGRFADTGIAMPDPHQEQIEDPIEAKLGQYEGLLAQRPFASLLVFEGPGNAAFEVTGLHQRGIKAVEVTVSGEEFEALPLYKGWQSVLIQDGSKTRTGLAAPTGEGILLIGLSEGVRVTYAFLDVKPGAPSAKEMRWHVVETYVCTVSHPYGYRPVPLSLCERIAGP